MIEMRKYATYLGKLIPGLALGMAVVSCSEEELSEIVPFFYTGGVESVSWMVDTVSFVPIQCENYEIASGASISYIDGGCFLVADAATGALSRFSSEGRYLNSFGKKGEVRCKDTGNTQYKDGRVYVFSESGRVSCYNPDGAHVSDTIYSYLGTQSHYVEDALLSTHEPELGGWYRLLSWKVEGKAARFLPSFDKSGAKVPGFRAFSDYDGSVYYTDSHDSSVRKYMNGALRKMLSVDFSELGPYTVPDADCSGAVLLAYNESDDMRTLEATIPSRRGPLSFYAVNIGFGWVWFNAGIRGKDLLAGSLFALDDRTMYFLLDMDSETFSTESLGYIPADYEKLRRLKAEGYRYVTAKVKMLKCSNYMDYKPVPELLSDRCRKTNPLLPIVS